MEKQRWAESERRRKEVRRSERRKSEKKEDAGARTSRKSRFTVFFQWFVAPEGRKVTWLKRRVLSQLARWEIKSCTPLWREAHVQVKMYKTRRSRTTFGSWEFRKSERRCGAKHITKFKCTNTPFSDHFWKPRGRKSARRYGAKHMSKSKV